MTYNNIIYNNNNQSTSVEIVRELPDSKEIAFVVYIPNTNKVRHITKKVKFILKYL